MRVDGVARVHTRDLEVLRAPFARRGVLSVGVGMQDGKKDLHLVRARH